MKKELIVNTELGISPYIKGRATSSKAFHLITVKNSLGEEFKFACEIDWTETRKARIRQAIERLKYPLTAGEQATLLSHVLLKGAAKKRRAITYAECDKLFRSLGIYYRLGILNKPELERKSIISDYCFLYQIRLAPNPYTPEDIESICGYAAQGFSIHEIMELYPDRDYQELYRLINRNKLHQKKRKQKSWSDEDIAKLKKSLKEGKTYRYIALHILPNRSPASIRAYASLIGVTKRGMRFNVTPDAMTAEAEMGEMLIEGN